MRSPALRPPVARRSGLLALVVLSFGLAGCATAPRPDHAVARAVEREDQRLAAEHEEQSALAAADLAPLELASAGATMEALGLLHLADPRPRPAAKARPAIAAAESDPDWVEGPPPSWLELPWPRGSAMEFEGDGDGLGDGPGPQSGDGASSDEGERGGRRRRGGGNKKPKVKMDLLNLHIRGRPVSFSGSLKGLKGVQLKATVKM